MDVFGKIIGEWWLVVLLLYLWSVMFHGTKNREKYRRWRIYEKKKRAEKK